MKVLLNIVISGFLICAGGKPLDESINPQALTYEQKLLLSSQQALQETKEAVYNSRAERLNDSDLALNQAKQQIGTDPDSIVNDLLDKNIHDYDPEYAQILSDIDRQHSLYKLTHRDLQWQVVAQTMVELDNDDRVELIKNVRRHPLHRRLPATIAITPRALNHWQVAREMFLKHVKASSRLVR